MNIFNTITILLSIAAVFSFINTRFLKLPSTIGLMVMSIVFTIGMLIIGQFSETASAFEQLYRENIDFKSITLDIMLSFLLFAGALHTDFSKLKEQRWPILSFATFGVLVSTLLIGTLFYYITQLIGYDIDLIYCMLFGALISPTDPIAVLGILKEAGVPKKLEIKIVGESLFNDGIGVVIFLTIFNIASKGSGDFNFSETAILFVQEVFGGIGLGLIMGYVAYRLIKSIDHYETEVMITLAMVMGGYLLATKLHLSGPLAVVVAGLVIGNHARRLAISHLTERYLDKFWELIDVYLNAILFVLIGMELLAINFESVYITIGLISIVVVLACRYTALIFPILIFRKKLDFVPKTATIMSWGGLRGGISIALALTLTPKMHNELILTVTYIVVVFSIIVQGLSLGKIVKKFGISEISKEQ